MGLGPSPSFSSVSCCQELDGRECGNEACTMMPCRQGGQTTPRGQVIREVSSSLGPGGSCRKGTSTQPSFLTPLGGHRRWCDTHHQNHHPKFHNCILRLLLVTSPTNPSCFVFVSSYSLRAAFLNLNSSWGLLVRSSLITTPISQSSFLFLTNKCLLSFFNGNPLPRIHVNVPLLNTCPYIYELHAHIFIYESYAWTNINASKPKLVLGHGSILGTCFTFTFQGAKVMTSDFLASYTLIHRDFSLTDSPMARTFLPYGLPRWH